MRALRLRVTGRVQGVGFRHFVVMEAGACGVVGDVRNLPDGSVEVRAEGDPTALDRLVEAVARGPRFAEVDGVVREDGPATGAFREFSVRF